MLSRWRYICSSHEHKFQFLKSTKNFLRKKKKLLNVKVEGLLQSSSTATFNISFERTHERKPSSLGDEHRTRLNLTRPQLSVDVQNIFPLFRVFIVSPCLLTSQSSLMCVVGCCLSSSAISYDLIWCDEIALPLSRLDSRRKKKSVRVSLLL